MDRASLLHHGGSSATPALALALLALVVLLAAPPTGRADSTPVSGQPEVVPNQLIVGFDADSTDAQQRKLVRKSGGKLGDQIDLIDAAVVYTKPNTTTDEVAAQLSRSDKVEFVEPNYVLQTARVPNDAAFGRLWGLWNSGQLHGTPGADVNAEGAWEVTTGGDVTVAVLDTGIQYTHPDLDGNVWTNPGEVVNGQDDDGDGYVDDVHGYDFVSDDGDPRDDSGHGTHVAGIIGAEGDNLIGTVGVNWNVKMMALKFLDSSGEGNTSDAAQAIDFAVASGARVINASWGGPAFSQALYQSVRRAGDRGVTFVAAAGNDGADIDSKPEYPAAFDLSNVISVAASDAADKLVDFSNYGRKSVDLAAPGDEIYSTVPPDISATGYASFSGTSMATPFVSGAAALYLSQFRASTAQQVRDAILRSVDVSAEFAGKTTSGGRLNVGRAVGAGRPSSAPPPPAVDRDTTPPSPFRLIRPKNHYRAHRRGLRFRWQRSHDASGIRYYKLFVDGKKRKTIRDPDGRPGGREPRVKTRLRLGDGRHRWFVRAYDYAGNVRTSRSVSRRTSSARSLVFVRSRGR
jgi:subtilisin family serine protease